MEVIKAIKSRRSVREFTDNEVDDTVLEEIIDAGRWAPSGLNNQAWRFIIIRDMGTKEELCGLTHYGSIIKNAPAFFELMAVIALGHPVQKNKVSERKELSQLVFREKFGKYWKMIPPTSFFTSCQKADFFQEYQ